MRENRPSETAGWVALWRGLGPWLPDGAQLVRDPFGAAFSPRLGRPFVELSARSPWVTRKAIAPFTNMIAWLQLRTRAIDDHLRVFLREGGRQLVLLGAGFDCRASRFSDELGVVFEIDHPATQAKKREVLSKLGAPSAKTHFVEWNFEHDAMSSLPERLRALGHDPTQPTFTIWEGVIPYLTEPAIAATVDAVRALGSRLAFTYITRAGVKKPLRLLTTFMGEPWRSGWERDEVPPWMARHGMRVLVDESDEELARRLFSRDIVYRSGGRHVALADPVTTG